MFWPDAVSGRDVVVVCWKPRVCLEAAVVWGSGIFQPMKRLGCDEWCVEVVVEEFGSDIVDLLPLLLLFLVEGAPEDGWVVGEGEVVEGVVVVVVVVVVTWPAVSLSLNSRG